MNDLRSLTCLSALVALVVLGQVPLGAAACPLEPAEAEVAQPDTKAPPDVADNPCFMPVPALAFSMRTASAERAAAPPLERRSRKPPSCGGPDSTGPPGNAA